MRGLQVNGIRDTTGDDLNYWMFYLSLNYGATNNNGDVLGLTLYANALGQSTHANSSAQAGW